VETLIYFLKDTPWYVYLIFFYLIFISIKSVRGGIVSLKKLFVIPTIFLLMSIDELVTRLHALPLYVVIFIIGLILGSIIGSVQYKMLQIRVDRQHKLFEIAGSWFAAGLIIITFMVKYYVGYSFALNNNMSTEFVCTLLLISSILTGTFIGRLIYVLYKLRIGPQVNLSVNLR